MHNTMNDVANDEPDSANKSQSVAVVDCGGRLLMAGSASLTPTKQVLHL